MFDTVTICMGGVSIYHQMKRNSQEGVSRRMNKVMKMGYSIRIAIPEDEQRIRELFIEMLQTIYHTEEVEGYESGCLNRYWTN